MSEIRVPAWWDHQELGEMEGPSPGTSGREQPCPQPDFGLLASELGENTFLLF